MTSEQVLELPSASKTPAVAIHVDAVDLLKDKNIAATSKAASPEISHCSGSRQAFATEFRRNAHAFRYDSSLNRSFGL